MTNKPEVLPASLLMQMINSAASGIVVTNASLTDNPIVFANNAFYEMTGYSPAETIGFNCRFLQHGDTQQPEIGKLRAAIKDNQSCVVTMRNYRKSGQMFWNELHIDSFTDPATDMLYFVGVQHDVTAHIELRQQRATYNAGLIHDIKGPLQGQIRALKLLNELPPDMEDAAIIRAELMESLLASSERIGKMLGFYKLENDVVAPQSTTFEARELTERVAADSKELLKHKNVQLQILDTSDRSCLVYADYNMAYRALKNLIENAIRVSAPGDTISLLFSNTISSSVLVVMDEGPGLPEPLKDTISSGKAVFQSSFSNPDRESTGLGLMTCAQIMRLHNGSLSLFKSDKEGASLALIFPKANSASN